MWPWTDVNGMAAAQLNIRSKMMRFIYPRGNDFIMKRIFYAMALHEIDYSTNHHSRLNRDMLGNRRSPEYAREELLSEMASTFMQMELDFSLPKAGMKEHTEQHAVYVQSWPKHLKEDYKELYRSTQDASK